MKDNKRLKRRVRNSYIVSTVSMALVLFLLGSVGYLMTAALRVARTLQESVTVTVELADGVDSLRRGEIERRLRGDEMVRDIEFVSKQTKIGDVRRKRISALSKGYKQRVGIAQALLGNPEVIILDEPTVGLDPKQIIEIRDLIKGLKQKHTVILSSHILSEVRAVCDYVLIISHGKLVASDTPDNLERLAAGSNSLLMKVKGEKDTIRKALETIEGVTGVEMSYDSDEKLWKTKLSIQENVDIREKVFYAMAKANCPIYEMQVKRVSLEDVFLEITQEGEEK